MLFMLFLGLRVYENVFNEFYNKKSRYSHKNLFMRSVNAISAFVRPNDITRNS